MPYDPIGPGTPAWKAYDRALDAWQSWRASGADSLTSAQYRRFRNQVQHMKYCLLRDGGTKATITQWVESLNRDKRAGA